MARAGTASGLFISPAIRGNSPSLHFHVIFTGHKETKASLRTAGELARDLGARVTLLMAEVVPYPLPIDQPPISAEFMETLLAQLAAAQDVETNVKLLLCRDRNDAIRGALVPDSIVVIGSRRRWWVSAERLLARLLRRDGHQVILVEGVSH